MKYILRQALALFLCQDEVRVIQRMYFLLIQRNIRVQMNKNTGAQYWTDDCVLYIATENDNSSDPDDDNDSYLDGEDPESLNDAVGP
jgi:hypothetical protein